MTTLIDVNASFDATRAVQLQAQQDLQKSFEQRIKDGKMVAIGGGRFQVRDPGSWDDGEIFLLSTDGTALPQHGLYENDGKVALYSAQPEWHNLGNIIPGGTSLISEALKAGGVDFQVRQSPVRFKASRKVMEVPGQFVNWRDDTEEPLGVVGSVYEPLQPRDSFQFLQDLTANYGILWESAGLTERNKLFVCTQVPEDIELDLAGAKDYVRLYLVTTDAWDGNHKFTTKVTPWRPRCGNTERFATRDAVASWGVRHTRTARERIEEAQRHLGLTVEYMNAFKAEEEQLARIDIEIDEFRAVTAELWPVPEEDKRSKRQVTVIGEREACLEGMWAAQQRETGKTAYSAERVFTDYLDHVAPRRAVGDKLAAARATAILEGSDDDRKTRAHKMLLQLAG